MAKKNTKTNKATKTPPPAKPEGVEFYFDKFAVAHQNPATKLIYTIFIPLLLFSIFALAWSIQFPYIKFLGRYNEDFNWSSILLAILIIYYRQFSLVLSFFMLFILLPVFYLITQMVAWQATGGPSLALIADGIFIISCVALFIGYTKEGKKLSLEYRYKNMLIAPLFLLHLVLKKFKIKY